MPEPTPALIPLRDRHGEPIAYAIVDASDFEWLNRLRWQFDHTYGYARRGEQVGHGAKDRVIRSVPMARRIMGLEYGDKREVDHINGNRLDNRRANLRIVSHAENSQNRTLIAVRGRAETSEYRGVVWERTSKRWRASVRIAGEHFNLGLFVDEKEAAEVAAAFRRRYMVGSTEYRVARLEEARARAEFGRSDAPSPPPRPPRARAHRSRLPDVPFPLRRG